MNTLESFLEYLDALGDHDLPVAAGLAALCRLADPIGQAPRQSWLAALHDLTAPSDSVADPTGPAGDAPGGLDDRVAGRLEAAQIASREPTEVAWDTVAFRPGLWDALRRARDQVQVACDDAVDRLRQGADERQAEPPTERSRLHAHHLTKIYKKRKVVNDVGIEVSQGEIVGLLGPNGAGKTTTFYMIVGLIPPNAGKVHLDDREITTVPMYKRARMGVGYLAQEPSVFRKLTVEENVKAILETTKQPRKARKERLEELLAELSLTHLRDNKAYSLSGGERRRLEITRAMVQRPKFLLLDEPFAGIDPIAVNDIQQIVAELKHRGIGVIITDHNVEQTLEIVDRAYIMYEGRIRVSGTVSELVWNDEVADIYLGPTLTQRMRLRYQRPDESP